jgi:hypothetical protein
MSKVISFRLNPDNPRDAKAIAVLLDWLSQGFSTRQTITEALLQLDSANSKSTDNEALMDLSQQIKELLENFDNVSSREMVSEAVSAKEKLSDGFVSSILKAAKPGLRQKI